MEIYHLLEADFFDTHFILHLSDLNKLFAWVLQLRVLHPWRGAKCKENEEVGHRDEVVPSRKFKLLVSVFRCEKKIPRKAGVLVKLNVLVRLVAEWP